VANWGKYSGIGLIGLRKTTNSSSQACLLIRCLAIDVILHAYAFAVNMFIESLPSSGSIRHNIYIQLHTNTRSSVNNKLHTFLSVHIEYLIRHGPHRKHGGQ
jgi:hypothetical protein